MAFGLWWTGRRLAFESVVTLEDVFHVVQAGVVTDCLTSREERFVDPASQRRMLDNFLEDLFRTAAERGIDVVVELANLNALLVDEALESGTVLGVVLGHDVAVLSLCNSLDQVLVALGQGAPERCVEACRKLRCRLVHARIVVVLGGFVELVSLVIPGATHSVASIAPETRFS